MGGPVLLLAAGPAVVDPAAAAAAGLGDEVASLAEDDEFPDVGSRGGAGLVVELDGGELGPPVRDGHRADDRRGSSAVRPRSLVVRLHSRADAHSPRLPGPPRQRPQFLRHRWPLLLHPLLHQGRRVAERPHLQSHQHGLGVLLRLEVRVLPAVDLDRVSLADLHVRRTHALLDLEQHSLLSHRSGSSEDTTLTLLFRSSETPGGA
mmetsp:Transcript_26616/g.86152  ORF Transcript_26616/g.86152 Transcript_26616/m.86152 type:complete len:206 (-) Transcript_26616:3-620(-)